MEFRRINYAACVCKSMGVSREQRYLPCNAFKFVCELSQLHCVKRLLSAFILLLSVELSGQSASLVVPEIFAYNPTLHCLDPTGRYFLTSSDSTVRLRDFRTGATLFVFMHQNVSDAQFSADGRRVLTISRDMAREWSIPECKMNFELQLGYSEGKLNGCGYSPDGRMIFLEGAGGSVMAYNEKGELQWKRELKSKKKKFRSVFFPDDTSLVGMTFDSSYVIINRKTTAQVSAGRKYRSKFLSVDFSSDSSVYFVSFRDYYKGDSVFAYYRNGDSLAYAFKGEISSNGRIVNVSKHELLSSCYSEIQIRSSVTGAIVRTYKQENGIEDVFWSPDYNCLAVLSNPYSKAKISLLNAQDGSIRSEAEFYFHATYTTDILKYSPVFSVDSKRIFYSEPYSIQCRNVRSFEQEYTCYSPIVLTRSSDVLNSSRHLIFNMDTVLLVLSRKTLDLLYTFEVNKNGGYGSNRFDWVELDSVNDVLTSFCEDTRSLTKWNLSSGYKIEEFELDDSGMERIENVGEQNGNGYVLDDYQYGAGIIAQIFQLSDSVNLFYFFDSRTGKKISELEDTVDCHYLSIELESADSYVYIKHNWGSTAASLTIFDLESGHLILNGSINRGNRLSSYYNLNADTVLLVFDVPDESDYYYRIINRRTGVTLKEFTGKNEIMFACVIENRSYTLEWDWDMQGLIQKHLGPDTIVNTIEMECPLWLNADPGHRYLCASYLRSPTRVYDLITGQPLAVLPEETQFSVDGKLIFSSNRFGGTDIRRIDIVTTMRIQEKTITRESLLGMRTEIVPDTISESALILSSPLSVLFFKGNDYAYLNQNHEYLATPGATKRLRFVRGLSVVEFEQIDLIKNRPDRVQILIDSITRTNDSVKVGAYHRMWMKRLKRAGIDSANVSDEFSVTVSSGFRTVPDYDQTTETLAIRIYATDTSVALATINLWVNNCPVWGRSGLNIADRNLQQFDTTFLIVLSKGVNRIEISAFNGKGIEGYRSTEYVNYLPESNVQPKTYFVGIGIDHFADPKYNLTWSSKDIRDQCAAMKKLYGDNFVVVDTLFNQNVTIENVQAIKTKLMKTNVNDRVIVAYSGHGLLSENYDYYLSTYDVNFHKPEERGLAYEELEKLVDSIPARQKLMLIDACHSGEVDKEEMLKIRQAKQDTSMHLVTGGKGFETDPDTSTRKLGTQNSFELMSTLFVNVRRGTGTTIIAAASGTQFAYENGELENGVFTYCFLETMKTEESCTVQQMKTRVSMRVVELTNGLQRPTSRTETSGYDWKLW